MCSKSLQATQSEAVSPKNMVSEFTSGEYLVVVGKDYLCVDAMQVNESCDQVS